MSGLVGGNVRVRVPVDRGTAAEGYSSLRSRALALLARDVFVLFVIALDAVILAVRLPGLFVGSDTWLALVGGRQVWQSGLPRHDTLTIFSHGATWVDQQWLGQLLMYGIHAAGGLRLLLVVHAVVLVAAFTLALCFARQSGASSRSVGLVGVVALFVALPNSTVRTQAFAYVFFVLLFWLLASDARAPSRRVFFALPLLILWGNIHGSVTLGAGLVVVWAVAELIRAGRRADAWDRRLRAVALAVAAPLCLLVSPYGFGLVGYYHDILGSGTFRDVVSEWHPAVFPDQLPFFLLAIGGLWLVARKPSRLSLFEHLAFVSMLVGGLDAVRNMVWFALVAAMVVPRALDGVWPVAEAPFRRRINLTLGLVSAAILVGAFIGLATRPSRWYERNYPNRAAQAVAVAATRDPSLRVFSNERYSDWLLWKAPLLSGRVAFDARFELLSRTQLEAVAHFRHQSSADWLAVARGYRLLVLEPETERPAIRVVLRERGARALYRDRHVAVLLRAAQSAS